MSVRPSHSSQVLAAVQQLRLSSAILHSAKVIGSCHVVDGPMSCGFQGGLRAGLCRRALCRAYVLPTGQHSATQRIEACQPAAAGHGSDAGAPRWRVRRRAGARASHSGRAGRPESPARCRAGACCPPWPALWRQAALAAGGPSAQNGCAATSTGAENGFLAGMLYAILRGHSCPTP
jgi:hypothetical protein